MLYKFNLIEHILLSQNIIPHPLADAATHIGLSKSLGLAVKLGITDQLNSHFQPTASIAQKCDISEKGCMLLLNCLEALGYVNQQGQTYAFNKRGQKFLAPDSPHSFKYFILFSNLLYDSFNTLEDSIVSGESKRNVWEIYNEEEWEIFTKAMIEIARSNLREIVKKIKVSADAKQIIDLGGSHGLYSIGLCQKHANLEAKVIDFEVISPYANDCIREHKMEKRVEFIAGDFMKDEIPGENDLALMFNIIHGFEKEDNQLLFNKVYTHLNPKGQLVILDQINQIAGKSQFARATTSFMGLNLFHQANGNTYSFDQVKSWAVEAGFQSVRMSKLHGPGFGLITCVK